MQLPNIFRRDLKLAPVRSSTSTSTEVAWEDSLGPTRGHGLMLLRHARAPVTCFCDSTGWKTNEERSGCFVCRFCSRRSTGIVLHSAGPWEMHCETAWTRGFNGLYTVVLRIAHTENLSESTSDPEAPGVQ